MRDEAPGGGFVQDPPPAGGRWVPEPAATSDAISVKCPTCDHARTIVFDHAASRVTGPCPRCSPDEVTSHLTPDVKALRGEVQRLRGELEAARETAIGQVVAWIRFEYAQGRSDAIFSYYGLALADDIERRLLRIDAERRRRA
jgi:ribosomal protein S27E